MLDPYSTMASADPGNHGGIIRISGEGNGVARVAVGIVLLLAAGCAGSAGDTPVETATEIAIGVIDPPPSEADAADALAASPRRGEWVDIELAGSERPITTWIVRPDGSADAPVVLVLHEIFGVYPGFPTLFWGLSGFFVNDLMGKALWKLVGNAQRFPRCGGRVLCVHGAVSFHRAHLYATRSPRPRTAVDP